MARTPQTVPMKLHDLMLLLHYRWAAVQSPVGELGDRLHEELVDEIDAQSQVFVKPRQLADLVHHMREVVLEKVQPAKLELSTRNHNKIMRRLKQQNPELFKTNSAGEIEMVELEERTWDS